MVIGFDTYHDSEKSGLSCGGFVASLNKSLTRYYSQAIFQSRHEELVSGLKAMYQGKAAELPCHPGLFPVMICMSTIGSSLYVAALKKFHEVNKTLPKKIVIYRDGVGDGQLQAVFDHELKQIIAANKMIGQDYRYVNDCIS